MEMNKNRTWAEISLDAITHNYQEIAKHAGVPVLCVVKADAYGHGAVQVARRLQQEGASYFAAATVSEAVELRENGIEKPILILGYVDQADMETAVQHRITIPIYDTETAQMVSRAAQTVGKSVRVHYKLDTGMTRLGFPSWEREQTVREILSCARLPGLESEGIFTHFSVSDVTDGAAYTQLQHARFRAVCEDLKQAGLDLPLRHCANSGAIGHYADTHETMVRAGIILYGYRPDPAVDFPLSLRPAMTVRARVVQVREVPAQTSISYGRTYTTEAPCRIAVVAMGYADGFLRTGSGKARVLIGDQCAPVLGRICMDMCMIEVPQDVKLHRGDAVTIFGPQGWTADDVAAAAGTISYEVLCAVSRRVPRFYVG